MENHPIALTTFQSDFLQAMGIQNDALSPEEKAGILTMVDDHLQKILIETVLENLREDQLQEFQKALDNPATMEDVISRLTAEVPGLHYKIEAAIRDEIEIIKTARQAI